MAISIVLRLLLAASSVVAQQLASNLTAGNEAETLAAAVSAFAVLDPGTTGGPPIAVDKCGPGVLCPTDRLVETETVYKTTLSTTEITTTRVETRLPTKYFEHLVIEIIEEPTATEGICTTKTTVSRDYPKVITYTYTTTETDWVLPTTTTTRTETSWRPYISISLCTPDSSVFPPISPQAKPTSPPGSGNIPAAVVGEGGAAEHESDSGTQNILGRILGGGSEGSAEHAEL